jgi:hypothetical protein
MRSVMHHPDDATTHYSTAEGWFYVCDDGTEVGPFASEWEMFKYVEDIDIHEELPPELPKPEKP